MVGMFDALGTPLKNPESIIYVEAKYSSFVDDPNTNKIFSSFTKVILEKCDIAKHFGNYTEVFNKVPFFNNWFCFQPGKYNLTLFGKYGDVNGFSFMDFFL